LFVAALLIILVLTLAPSVTRGNINLRVYALIPRGAVTHLFASFSDIQLHVAGLPESSGWFKVAQNPTGPNVDLIPQSEQLIPGVILSASINSGRYDSIKMTFSNSTIVFDGGQRASLPAAITPLSANTVVSVAPNGNGDVLFILSLDYSLLISTSPSISASIAQVTSF
jgi:hypothetical protein